MAITKVTTTVAELENLEIDGTEAARMPVGSTAQRANGQVGDLRHNTDTGVLEQYTADGWTAIAAFPVVSSISPSAIPETDGSFDITVSGSSFTSGATVIAIGQDSSTVSPSSTSRTNSTTLVATFDGADFDNAQEPYSIKVTNNTGLTSTLDDILDLNATPSWTTAASPTILSTIYQGTALSSVSVSATDPEGGSVTYSLDSGSLPTGLTINSDGTITGTPSGGTYASGGESFTPTISATDGSNSVNRTFNIVRKWYDGTTEAQANTSAADIITHTGSSSLSDGLYWIRPAGYGSAFQVYCRMQAVGSSGTGWMMLMNWYGSNSSDFRVDSDLNADTPSVQSSNLGQSSSTFRYLPLAKRDAIWNAGLNSNSLIYDRARNVAFTTNDTDNIKGWFGPHRLSWGQANPGHRDVDRNTVIVYDPSNVASFISGNNARYHWSNSGMAVREVWDATDGQSIMGIRGDTWVTGGSDQWVEIFVK